MGRVVEPRHEGSRRRGAGHGASAERKPTERQPRELLASIIDQVAEGVVVADATGRFLVFNPAAERLFGAHAAELPPEKWASEYGLYLADGVTPFPTDQMCLAKAIRGEPSDQVPMVVRNAANPKGRSLSATARPLRDASGTVSGGVAIFRDVSEQVRTQGQLEATVAALREQTDVLVALGEMGELLAASRNESEANAVMARFGNELFPGWSGAVYMINASHNLIEANGVWGAPPTAGRVFGPEDCWALRRGQLHTADGSDTSLACAHLEASEHEQAVCAPLMAQGEALGVLSLRHVGAPSVPLDENRRRLVISFAKQAALTLSNLRLRETLRSQSIRDALTGLFNRRYMEEWLEKELLRSARHARPLTVLMLDVDHFKRVNDGFGHTAGDLVLRDLGQLLRDNIRAGDVGCRYGGDEFVLLLPESDLESGRDRADQIRRSVYAWKARAGRRFCEPVTLSIGVAAFPLHGLSVDALVLHADAALYRAKRLGRDRVVVADEETRSSAPASPRSAQPRQPRGSIPPPVARAARVEAEVAPVEHGDNDEPKPPASPELRKRLEYHTPAS